MLSIYIPDIKIVFNISINSPIATTVTCRSTSTNIVKHILKTNTFFKVPTI